MEKYSSLRWNLWRRHYAASSIFASWQILSTRWDQECLIHSCSGVWPNWTKTEPPLVLQIRIWHHHWTKLSNPSGKYWTNFAVQKIISKYMESICLNVFGECAERIYAYMEKTQRACPRVLFYAKRHKSVYISVNNNMNLKKNFRFFQSTLYGMD